MEKNVWTNRSMFMAYEFVFRWPVPLVLLTTRRLDLACFMTSVYHLSQAIYNFSPARNPIRQACVTKPDETCKNI